MLMKLHISGGIKILYKQVHEDMGFLSCSISQIDTSNSLGSNFIFVGLVLVPKQRQPQAFEVTIILGLSVKF